ncbi:hypothetical protein [Mastigocladopsis repens]|uniref:hypothetical protein n=1 Tax=Mastigocladopsis repens TaxID=221287 RepID=UPI0002DB2F1E|nr:hypothetical protein [Mastigocladopsis repens]
MSLSRWYLPLQIVFKESVALDSKEKYNVFSLLSSATTCDVPTKSSTDWYKVCYIIAKVSGGTVIVDYVRDRCVEIIFFTDVIG